MQEAAADESAATTRNAGTDPATRVDEIDLSRAREYALLSVLLARAPSADLLSGLAALNGDASPLGRARRGLAAAARAADAGTAGREYFELFVGVGRGELLPYASYYLTGFLYERPLAELRDDLAALGLERAEDNPEPEDHLSALCEVMAGLASGQFAADFAGQCAFFARHLAPWAERFFTDLEHAEAARFYRAVGAYGAELMRIERAAFTMD